MMKALGIPEDRICKTIINPRTGKPVSPMTLARAFANELASGATEFHTLHNLLKPCPSPARWNGSPSRRNRAESQRRTSPPPALRSNEGGPTTKLAVAEGPRVRIHLPPAASQERTLRDLALDLSVLTEPEGFRRSSDQLNYRVGVLRLKRLG